MSVGGTISSVRVALLRPFSRIGVKDRLLLAVLVTVAVALISMTVAFNLVLVSTLTSDADARLYKLAQDESGMIAVSASGVSLPQPTGQLTDLGSQVWVFVGGQTVSGPTVDPDIDAAAKALDGSCRRVHQRAGPRRTPVLDRPVLQRQRASAPSSPGCPWPPSTAPRG